MSELSTFLFSRPSFAEGLGRLFDFGNTLHEYNRSDSAEEVDRRAIYADFRVVGQEIETAIREANSGKVQP